jgi:endonuclease-8
MPEGDTIYRSAVSLRRWVGGRQVTAASGNRIRFDPARLVGDTVEAVESRAKHLLVHFDSGWVLHTHMRMTGSWHCYPAGERWRKPPSQARLVLTAGARVAVCFNAPVVELRRQGELAADPSLRRLGPDVLGAELPGPAELAARAAARAEASPTVGELLLDQGVVSGIGNIYRCEALFLCRVDPRTPSAELDPATLAALVTTASRLMAANAAGSAVARRFDGPPEQTWVYRRAGRPCRRCGSVVRSEPLGSPPRTAYWCPTCQAGAGGSLPR